MWVAILWGWLKPIVITLGALLLKEGGQRLYTVAKLVVTELQTTELSNSSKREEAVIRIIALLKTEGLAFGESAIRMVIELAVQELKKEKA